MNLKRKDQKVGSKGGIYTKDKDTIIDFVPEIIIANTNVFIHNSVFEYSR